MDAILWWLWLIAKVLLVFVSIRVVIWLVFRVVEKVWGVAVSARGYRFFRLEEVTVKTDDAQLTLQDIYFSIRWLDKSCRRFFKFNVRSVQLQVSRVPPLLSGGGRDKSAAKTVDKIKVRKMLISGVSFQRRIAYRATAWLAKVCDVWLGKFEMMVQDLCSSDIGFLDMVQLLGVELTARPLPHRVMALSVDMHQASVQSYLCVGQDEPNVMDNSLFSVLECTLGCRALVFLTPVSPLGRVVDTIQLSLLPLSLNLHASTLNEFVNRFTHSAGRQDHIDVADDSSSSLAPPGWDIHSLGRVPKKIEVVVEKFAIRYYPNEDSRRVFAVAASKLSLEASIGESLGGLAQEGSLLDLSFCVHGLSVQPLLSAELLKLHYFRLVSKLADGTLSSSISALSLKATLLEDEVQYWTLHFFQLARALQYSLSRSQNIHSDRLTSSVSILQRVYTLPVSVVTTVGFCDWLLLVRLDSPSLQSVKDPLCKVVMADARSKLQFGMPENGKVSVPVCASVNIHNCYLHIPGLTLPRPDRPKSLPSSFRHQWGRFLSLGSAFVTVTASIEPISSAALSRAKASFSSTKHASYPGAEKSSASLAGRDNNSELRLAGVCVDGNVSSMMIELCSPLLIVVTKALQYLDKHYHLVSWLSWKRSMPTRSSKRLSKEAVAKSRRRWSAPASPLEHESTGKDGMRGMEVNFFVSGLNLFLYQTSQVPAAITIRIDGLSFSPSDHLHMLSLYRLAANELHLSHEIEQGYPCVPVASLPPGILDVTNFQLHYNRAIKEVGIIMESVETTWTAHVHCTLTETLSSIAGHVTQLRGLLTKATLPTDRRQFAPRSYSIAEPELVSGGDYVSVGEVMERTLCRVRVRLNMEMERGIGVFYLDERKYSKVTLGLQTSHCCLKEGEVTVDVHKLDLSFDNNSILHLENFISEFPHQLPAGNQQQQGGGGMVTVMEKEKGEEEEDDEDDDDDEEMEGELQRERVKERFKDMTLAQNPIINLFASRVIIEFPNGYNFASTYEKLMCMRKFVLAYHKQRRNRSPSREKTPLSVAIGEYGPVLPPDVLLELDEVVFQLEDNALEVKMRANYELMSDEQEQRQQRLDALEAELDQIRHTQGLLFPAKKVQGVYKGLQEKDASIYCQRAQELYSSNSLNTQLFTVNMQQTRLLIMSDPSLLGTDNLIKHLCEIDDVSPLPHPKYQFSTLWGVYLSGTVERVEAQLRDYNWKLLEGDTVGLCGRLLLAEQEAEERECRSVVVKVGEPWEDVTIVRKLSPLKYYHDLDMTADSLIISWGPCFDPCFSQMNYAFTFITKPSADPSHPIPWWDKLRLLLHGKARVQAFQLVVNLLASQDPYNTAECMEVRLLDIDIRLCDNVALNLVGGAKVLIHTASRYDECELLFLPLAKARLGFEWLCRGEPHHHHHVVRCLDSKLPVLPEGQEHDSYRVFRSKHLNISLQMEVVKKENTEPEIHLHASTLRWLQQYVMMVRSAVSKPIRKGRVFKNVKPKKLRFTRHLKNIQLSVSLPPSTITYWTSVTKKQGLEFHFGKASFDIGYELSLVPYNEGLIRRPRAVWSVLACSGNLTNIAIHTCLWIDREGKLDAATIASTEPYALFIIGNPHAQEPEEMRDSRDTLEKRILITMDKLSYTRQSEGGETSEKSGMQEFTHELKTDNTRMVWNSVHRNVLYKILDSYRLFQRIKRDLSAEALQSILTKMDARGPEMDGSPAFSSSSPEKESDGGKSKKKTKPLLRLSSSGCVMLDQLLADTCNMLVYSQEQKEPSDPRLKGIVAAQKHDVKHHNWIVKLVSTQVALQGVEKAGYIVCSSYITQIFGREHNPVWREGDLVGKNSWVAQIQDLQYFSTIDQQPGTTDDNQGIPWLPLTVIMNPDSVADPAQPHEHTLQTAEEEQADISLLLKQLGPDLKHPEGAQLGSNQYPEDAVGGMVNTLMDHGMVVEDPVGTRIRPLSPLLQRPSSEVQLQRIASRCHCQVFYITYGGQVDPDSRPSPELLSPTRGLASQSNDCVDTFTFRYPSTEVCTTSSQYALLMDIVNNLLLYKEPRKKEATEQHARMKFMLQLSNIADSRKPVLAKQNKIRQILVRVNGLEKELYVEQKSGTDCSLQERNALVKELSKTKEELAQASLELRAMIRAFKERQLYMLPAKSDSSKFVSPEPVRRIEIWVDDAQWSLMHEDGQLKAAEIRFSNFSYNRELFSDDSGVHRFELGTFNVRNCMPNTPAIYKEVLSSYDPQSRRLRVDKNISLRIYCRDQAPVAGIPVTEHLELNVVPLAVCLTEKFYNTMQEFFLPRTDLDGKDVTSEQDHSHVFGVQPTYSSGVTDAPDGTSFSRTSSIRRNTSGLTSSAPSVTRSQMSPPDSPVVREPRKSKRAPVKIDEVEKMQARASNIKTFIYVKIPQTTLCLTYKGESISLKEMHEQLVTVQTLEYHNHNWTWRSLLMEIKKDYMNAIIAQTLKSAIGIKQSEENAGLVSPKLGRGSTSEILMGRIKESKAKSKKLFGKLSSSKDDHDEEGHVERSASCEEAYRPPLTDPETSVRRNLYPSSVKKKK